MKTIEVSDETYRTLFGLKTEFGFRKFVKSDDSVKNMQEISWDEFFNGLFSLMDALRYGSIEKDFKDWCKSHNVKPKDANMSDYINDCIRRWRSKKWKK